MKWLRALATGGLIVAALGMSLGESRSQQLLQGLAMLVRPAPAETKVDIRSLVLQQVQGASELTTVIFGMEAVVPTSRDRTVAGYVIGKTTLLYIAYGEVRAGVDLGELKPEDIQLDGDRIRIQLPPPQILDSKIDVARSQVYDYDRGFLGLGPDAAPDLQTQAQQEVLTKIVEAACQQDILEEASSKAELAIAQLMQVAGFKQVEAIASPTNESCMPDAKEFTDT